MNVNIIVERLACSNPAKVILTKIWVCSSKQLQINPFYFYREKKYHIRAFHMERSQARISSLRPFKKAIYVPCSKEWTAGLIHITCSKSQSNILHKLLKMWRRLIALDSQWN